MPSQPATSSPSAAAAARPLPGWRRSLGLFGLVLLAYAPALWGAFIWNDRDYVTRPELRSWHGLGRIWSEVGATEQYYPLLHTAFWVEHRLWGDSALGYHLANILLHATAACLLAAVLRRLAVPGAWLAAALFALHPVCVESVAWISEQKNTLSTVFYLLAALVYLGFDRGRETSTGRAATYVLATILFLCALLAKSVTATLPAALLVVFWWRRGKLEWRRDFRPLLPWFVLGAADGLFTGWVERRFLGAEGADFALTLVQRCLLAGRALWFYLGKLAWPVDLIFIYPHWTIKTDALWPYLFPLAVAVLALALWRIRRRTRAPLAGFLFFAGTLFPTLGFFNVYAFVFSYVADHWVYLASLGVIVPVAAGWSRVGWGAARLRSLDANDDAASFSSARGATKNLKILRLAAPVVVGLLGVLTWRQSRMYTDIETFYRTTLARNPASWMAQNNLGVLLVDSGRAAEALPHYEETLRLRPNYAEGHLNLGVALFKTGRLEEARAQYREALRLRPTLAAADFNLGLADDGLGQTAAAAADFAAALTLQPDFAEADYYLGNALIDLKRPAEAIGPYETALALRPGLIEARDNLGNALRLARRTPEAIQCHEEALRRAPDNPVTQFDLGIDLADSDRLPEAIGHYEEALRLRPAFPEAEENLGVALAKAGRLSEAIPHFRAALRLKPDYAKARRDLDLAVEVAARGDGTKAKEPTP